MVWLFYFLFYIYIRRICTFRHKSGAKTLKSAGNSLQRLSSSERCTHSLLTNFDTFPITPSPLSRTPLSTSICHPRLSLASFESGRQRTTRTPVQVTMPSAQPLMRPSLESRVCHLPRQHGLQLRNEPLSSHGPEKLGSQTRAWSQNRGPGS